MTRRLLISAIALWLGVLFPLPVAAQTPQPTPPPQGTGRITGVVTRGDTGRPVPDVTVRAVRWEGGRGQQSAVRTDAAGRFVIANALPGSFQLTATAEGFVTIDFGQRTPGEPGKRIELADGQQFNEADIVLQRTSAVEGRLLDEFGDPVPGVTVQLAQVQFAAGKTRLMPVGGPQPRPTDDLGQFRVFGLAPGDYYVLALSGPFANQDTTAAGFAVSYFPGTAAPTDARPVHVGIGQDARDVTFALQPAPLATIAGLAVDQDGKPVPNANLMLVQTSGDDVRSFVIARGIAGPDGAFSFSNVAQGTYVIQAFGRPVGGGNLSRAPFGALPVAATGDRRDLRLTIRPGAVARGRFLFEGDNSGLRPEVVTAYPAPIEFVMSPVGGGPPGMVTNPDWTFETQNQVGLRVMRPNIGAPGWTLKSVVVAGKDVTDAPLDFSKGDINDIEITLTNRVSTVNGTVTDGEAPAREFSVVLFAEDANLWAFPSRFLAVARPNPAQPGSFRVAGLPPGAYLAAAVPVVNGFEYQDPAFLQALRPLATRVVVNEGDTKAVTLKIIKR